MDTKVSRIEKCLSALRVGVAASEYELHQQIASCLAEGGFRVCHEYRLGPRRRIDFWVDGVGVEVKKGRPAPARLRAQAEAYLASPELDALILVVERTANVPRTLAGKPVSLFCLNRLWGVALP